jgi:hypothetical protein
MVLARPDSIFVVPFHQKIIDQDAGGEPEGDVTRYGGRNPMTAPAERMKMMRQRRRARGLRELRLVVADARSRAVRRRVAKQVSGLDPDRERDALQWIESVSEFGADATR